MKRWMLVPALFALSIPMVALPAQAQDSQQQQEPTPPPEVGTVSGSVMAPSGAGIIGATVTLSAGQTTTTDGNGQFMFSDVTPGGYAVGVDARGYQSVQVSVNVRGSNDSRMDVLLQPGS